MRQRMPRSAIMITRCLKLSLKLAYLSFAKNASAGIALRCRAFVTVMQAAAEHADIACPVLNESSIRGG